VLKVEIDKMRAEHSRTAKDAEMRAEAERKAHASALEGRLMDKERNTGVLEGQMQALSSENQALRTQLADLQTQLRDSEGRAGQYQREKEYLSTDLDKAKAETAEVKASAAEKEQRIQDEKNQEIEKMKEQAMVADSKSQPKCGCSVQ